MSTPANGQYVDERLEDLYRRHLLVGEGSVASYYESGRGYYESGRGYYDPELAAEAEDALLVPTESRAIGMNKVLMIVAVFGSICLLARKLRSDSQPLLRNLFGVLVALDRFFSGRRSSGRDHRGEDPACCFHEKAAPLGRQIPLSFRTHLSIRFRIKSWAACALSAPLNSSS